MLFRKRRARAERPTTTLETYHCVEIVQPPGEPACSAVEQLKGGKFLSERAPSLPIRSCSRPDQCRCVYKHFTDRRSIDRRESDVGLPERVVATERRNHRRRCSDRSR